ncbi:MAG TPA: glycosyltransferase family 2 protein [Bacteroidia bacterium]|nr:glycosyltransferase family 2 protein [Bacteroidia bacterium]
MKAPKVTVLMPVYNGEKYLQESIDSILNQSFHDFEFLIINDGSTDNSAKIISSCNDPRIRFINNEKRSGLIASLNNGFDLASGEYVARMDCDDTSVKQRLSVQVNFMNKHKNTGVCGSFYYLTRDKKKAVTDLPLSDREIRCFLLFNSPIAHPAAMIRMSVVKKYNVRYNAEYIHAEDYDLWSRLSQLSGLQNISKKLLNYRVHDKQVSGDVNESVKKLKSVSAVRVRHLREFGVNPSKEEIHIHNLLGDGMAPVSIDEIKLAEQWLQKLNKLNDEKKLFDRGYFQKIILERWLRLCFNFFKGQGGIKYFYQSEIFSMIKLPAKRKLELVQSLYFSWKRWRIKN